MAAEADDLPETPGEPGARVRETAPRGDTSPGAAPARAGAPGDGAVRPVHLEAPITAVVVYPTAARVTRRGALHLPPADLPPADLPSSASSPTRVEVVVGGLPLGLDEDSVRVGGTGPARILGVRVVSQARATLDAGALADLHARQDELRASLTEIDDEDETERARRSFLDVAARVGAGALARGWAGGRGGHGGPGGSGGPPGGAGGSGGQGQASGDEPGRAGPTAQLVEVGDALAAQIAGVHARRRALAERREATRKELARLDRIIEARRAQSTPDTRAIVVDLELPAGAPVTAPAPAKEAPTVPAAAGAVELEVSYLVGSASWSSGYDARLEGERVTLTWFAMISQRTGEDWPETDLRLSTARPASGFALPELAPQFVDIRRPPEYAAGSVRGMAGAPGGSGQPGLEMAALAAAAPRPAAPPVAMVAAQATLESTGAASTYRPPRPVAVPADGDPHRATVAVIELDAVLDHVTVPKLAAEAHLRAAVVNTSPHTLPAGKVSVFHDQEFVGSTRLDLTPPGGELELRLGVDDRIRVDRELVRRVTGRRMVGNTRRTDVGYTIVVTNHAPLLARVTVRDQVPVSRHESVTIKDVVTEPAADELTELGLVTWQVELAPGADREIRLSYRLEHPRGAELTGWGD